MGEHLKWNAETSEALDEFKNIDEFIGDLAEATRQRLRIKELEAEIETLKAKSSKLAMTALQVLQFEKVESNLGTLTRVKGSSVSVDSKGVKEYLVGKGVSTVIVKNAFEKNTKKTPTDYVKFTLPKKAKGGK